MYKGIVRPQFQYAVQSWVPNLVQDKIILEKFQRVFKRKTQGLRGLTYQAELESLELQPLCHKRLIGDLVIAFKLLRSLPCRDAPLFIFDENPPQRKE